MIHFFRKAKKLNAIIALTLIVGLLQACSSSSSYRKVKDDIQPIAGPPAGFKPIKVVLMDFKNSARIKSFDIVDDKFYKKPLAKPKPRAKTGAWTDAPKPKAVTVTPTPVDKSKDVKKVEPKTVDTKPKPDPVPKPKVITKPKPKTFKKVLKKKKKVPPPPPLNSARLAREITATLLHQTGRFELIAPHILLEAKAKLEKENPGDPLNLYRAAQKLNIKYILYGDLVNFEIKKKTNYWKVPLWVILLIAAAFIKSDDLRAHAIYLIIRLTTSSPMAGIMWKSGLGWQKLRLIVDVEMNLRMVNTSTGTVAFSDSRGIKRTDTVRNLQLFVWESNNRLQITRSNAGKQIRFASRDNVDALAKWVDVNARREIPKSLPEPPKAK